MQAAESHAPDMKETALAAVATTALEREAAAGITADTPAADNKPHYTVT